jgi:hypothetical protein
MDQIVCRRDEIGNTNEVPFVLGQEPPSYRYKSLQFFTILYLSPVHFRLVSPLDSEACFSGSAFRFLRRLLC